jgi:hypothetical protein
VIVTYLTGDIQRRVTHSLRVRNMGLVEVNVAEMVALGSGQTPFGKMGCKEIGYCPRMIVPMMPPMAPASVVCGSAWRARYGSSAWARMGSGMDCSQIWPGPVSAAYLAEGRCPISASLGPCVMALWMA